MKAFNLWMALLVLVSCAPLAAQESADDLEFESETLTKPYKPKGKHYVFIRSKRGKSGVGTTTSADSITSIPINEIVLVYTETGGASEEARDEANKERWNNLMKTYPEFFQYSSTYINKCQCNPAGDTAAYKKAQGFYVYYQADETAVEEPEPPAKEEPVAKKEPEKAAPAPEEKKSAPPSKEKENKTAAVTTGVAVGAAAASEKSKNKKEEPAPEEPAKPAKKEKIEETVATVPETKEEPEAETPPVKAAPKKKPAVAKVRKAKDPKACRPACFGYGDEDLIGYFKDNITLTKKEKRKGKNLIASLSLQLNPDGSIKKAMVSGSNQDFNERIQTAANAMGRWNPAVKNGVTIKSQVKMNLKFDKASKSIRPSEIMVTPRPGPKCVCVSDEEIFGSE